ncbi:MAG: ATP-binding cassette domain-containing protein, partial [Beijerinckiaceae bacterium]
IGDNGAGKSTLIKCLTGALQPDRGEILLEGKRVEFKSPLESRQAGIETVYQTLAVAPALDIASNMYLGRERRMPGPVGLITRRLDKRGMVKSAREEMTKLGISTLQDMRQRVETLSGGQRQAVAIARAVYWDAKLMIMDEPTNNLGVPEQRKVLDLIRRLRERGVPVILITHILPDAFAVADRLIVMHRGRKVAEKATAGTNTEELIRYMVGAIDDTSEDGALSATRETPSPQ